MGDWVLLYGNAARGRWADGGCVCRRSDDLGQRDLFAIAHDAVRVAIDGRRSLKLRRRCFRTETNATLIKQRRA
ncbi:hypothetical protein WI664_16075 [Vibrio cholerae]